MDNTSNRKHKTELSTWKTWKSELKAVRSSKRFLERVHGEHDTFEECVICDTATDRWLQPENTPLCSESCLHVYLKNPTMYDPRELYIPPPFNVN